MKKSRNDRNWYAQIRPAGAAAWVWIALACAVLMTFIGGPIVSVHAEEATDGTVQTDGSDASGDSDADEDGTEDETAADDAASATGSAERGVAVSGTDEDSITQEASSGGVYVTKSLTDNDDGTLQVELENYVTGQTYTGDAPADIILLLDTSYSMLGDLTSDTDRSDALQASAIEFIDSIVERNTGLESEYQSRIAIVSYCTFTTIHCDFMEATSETRDTLCSYINGLSFYGTTYMDKAFSQVQSSLLSDEAEDGRERIIVFFTDGYPTGNDAYGNFHIGFVKAAANRTLVLAQAMKSAGVKIYCISIHPLASADYSELPEYEEIEEDYFFTQMDVDNGDSDTITTTAENAAAIANRFMYLLSSYNPDALTVDDDGVTYSEDGETYYYTADNVSELISVFTTIADSSGVTYTELGAGTEVVDYITSDFELADASAVRVYTSDYLGNGSWGERVDITDQVTIEASSRCVRVSGFDYSANYVSETAHTGTDSYYGCKLIVSFPIVPADTFGGNGLETNEENSGIYAEDSDDPFVAYPVPAADVELVYEIGTEDSIVYVPDSAALSDLISYPEGYEPDGACNAHVTITYVMTDENGTVVGTLTIPAGSAASVCSWDWVTEEASDCGTYSISCTVTPTDTGTYGSIALSGSASVHVLYPVLTLQDTVQQYGDTPDIAAGDYLSESGLGEHFVSLDWGCSEGFSREELGAAEAPQLGYRIAISEGIDLEEEQYVICTTEDIPVVVGVYRISDNALAGDITSYTTFFHECGRSSCGYDAAEQGALGVRCLIHVDTEEETTDQEETEEPEMPEPGRPVQEPPRDDDSNPGSTEPSASAQEDNDEVSVTVTSTSVSASVTTVASSEEEADDGEEVSSAAETAADDISTDTTAANAIHSVSETGDDTQFLLWTFAAAAAVLIIAVCLICLRYRRKSS